MIGEFMISQDALYKVRNGICAIGYVTVPRNIYTQDPQSPYFKVVGTGFLLRETTVMTNRHVVDGLINQQEDLGFPDDQRVIIFTAPRPGNGLQIVIRRIRRLTRLAEEELDIGFVEFNVGPEDQFEGIVPLTIQENWTLPVGAPIAVSGYPYGHYMLQRNKRVYRWGPVVQQGYISAISPFDLVVTPNEILLDVRTAEGMSGAPIFHPDTGVVIGIHHSGWEATTALGLPLVAEKVSEWLNNYEKAWRSEPVI